MEFLRYRFAMTILPRFAAWLWVLGFFLSLDFGVFPAPELERLASVLCILAGAALLGLAGDPPAQRPIAAPAIACAVLSLWILVMLSALWSVSPGMSLLYGGAFSTMPATVLALLFATTGMREVFLRHALFAGGVVITGLCLWALAQVFLLPEYLVNGQVRHPFANPNAFAGLLTLCMLTTSGFFLKSDFKKGSIFLAVLFLFGSALAAIASQAATLTFIGGAGVALAFLGRDIKIKNLFLLLAVMGLVVLAGFVMAMLPEKTDVITRLSALASGHGRTWSNRLDIWSATLALIASNPFLGTGYKTFALVYPSVRLPSEIYSGGFMAHSDPLQFWVELGIGGMVLYYAVGILVLRRFCFWFRDGNRDPLTIFLFAGCLAFVVHSHVDFLLYTLPTMLAFALALAVLIFRTGHDAEKTVVPLSFARRLSAPYQAVLVLLPLGIVLYFFVPLMVSDYLSSKASRLIFSDVRGFANAVNAADKIGMGLNPRPYSMAVTVPLGILKSRYPALPLEEQRQLFRQTDHLISAGLRQNAQNAAMHYHRAELAQFVSPSVLSSGYPRPEESLKRALALNPLHLPSRLALAQIMQSRGEKQQALGLLADGLDWPYTTFDPMPYYAETIALAHQLNNPEVAAHVEKRQKTHNIRLQLFMRQKKAVQALRKEFRFLP